MFGFMKYINVPLFLVSLAIGLFFVYITMPDTRKIYVYPTPENNDILQYMDKTNSCFRFKQTEVPCPKNEDEIAKIPAQS
jgi:hypothetical protein